MIFVVAEHQDARLKPITTELLVFAQRLRRDFGQPITAVLLGSGIGPLVDDLKAKKIDRVMVDHPSSIIVKQAVNRTYAQAAAMYTAATS